MLYLSAHITHITHITKRAPIFLATTVGGTLANMVSEREQHPIKNKVGRPNKYKAQPTGSNVNPLSINPLREDYLQFQTYDTQGSITADDNLDILRRLEMWKDSSNTYKSWKNKTALSSKLLLLFCTEGNATDTKCRHWVG